MRLAYNSSVEQQYIFTAKVQLFPQDNGWHYVAVPSHISHPLRIFADRGLIAVHATVGDYTWNTSLLPKGDGSHFVALSAKMRNKEGIRLEDSVTMKFVLRER